MPPQSFFFNEILFFLCFPSRKIILRNTEILSFWKKECVRVATESKTFYTLHQTSLTNWLSTAVGWAHRQKAWIHPSIGAGTNGHAALHVHADSQCPWVEVLVGGGVTESNGLTRDAERQKSQRVEWIKSTCWVSGFNVLSQRFQRVASQAYYSPKRDNWDNWDNCFYAPNSPKPRVKRMKILVYIINNQLVRQYNTIHCYHFLLKKSLIFGSFSCIFHSKICIFSLFTPSVFTKTSQEQPFLITEIKTQIERIIGIYDDIDLSFWSNNDYYNIYSKYRYKYIYIS